MRVRVRSVVEVLDLGEVDLELDKDAAAVGVELEDVEDLAVVRGFDPRKLRAGGGARVVL